MARIRSVKPETFASYSLAEVSIEARFLFVGMWCEADDYGKLIDSPKRLAGAVFPHDEKVTEARVVRMLDELERVGCIRRYAAGSGRYICIPSWNEHQKVSHPGESRLPDPPESFAKSSGDSPETLRPDLGTGNREQGTGKAKAAQAFERFWSLYPRREGKAQAHRALEKALKVASIEDILAGVERYRDDPNRDPAFTKHPSTWLNGGCWEDEPLPPRKDRPHAPPQPPPPPAPIRNFPLEQARSQLAALERMADADPDEVDRARRYVAELETTG